MAQIVMVIVIFSCYYLRKKEIWSSRLEYSLRI